VKIELLSISKAGGDSFQSARQAISRRISDALGCEVGGLKAFDSTRAFLEEMSSAFLRSDIIIAAAGSDIFPEQKWTLLKALGLTSELNEAIVSEISASGTDVDDSSLKAHALMPVGADVFLTPGALNSGFAVAGGKQTLIFMPLDEELSADMLESGIIPFLKSAAAASRFGGGSDDFPSVSELLAQNKTTVSLAATQTSIFARQRIEAGNFTDVYSFVESDDTKKSGETLKDCIARLADKARADGGADLGAIISNVYSSNGAAGKLFVYAAVSGSSHAHIKKITSRDGETANELVETATSMLFTMLSEFVKADGIPPADAPVSEIQGVEEAEDAQDPTRKRSTAIKVVTGVAIALIMCLLIGFFFRDVRAFFFGGGKPALVSVIESEPHSDNESETAAPVIELENPFCEPTPTEAEDAAEKAVAADIAIKYTSASKAEASSGTQAQTETSSAVTTSTTAATAATTATATTKKAAETETASAKADTTEKPAATAAPTQAETKPESTEARETEADSVDAESKGKFTFTAYGYGHGVGMSQNGALTYGNSSGGYNWDYSRILYHYYPGTVLKTDSFMPMFINFNGSYIPTRTFLERVTNAEIGGSCKDAVAEGCKAQVVAIYTYLKYHIDNGSGCFVTGDLAYKTSEPSALIRSAVDAVYGQYLDYNGSAAFTPFSSSCAGKSSSASGTWGGKSYPYLSGGISSPEEISVRTLTLSADSLKECVERYNSGLSDSGNKITLSGDPSSWIEIISHDGAYGKNVGYITKIRLGDREIGGNTFRSILGYSSLRSHCFAMSYSAKS
jgi:SpoIID/LytB domain protein